MKDLYTFDISLESALETYKLACNAYRSVFASMKLPILMAEASPGNIGGDLSHEYHLPSPSGEDTVINCINCNYVANEERAESRITVENRGLGSTGGCSTRCTKEQLAKMLSEAVHKGEADGQLHGVVRDSQNPRMVTDWLGITQDRSTIIQAFMPCTLIDQTSDQAPPRQTEVNLFTIKELCPDVDLSVEDALLAWRHHRATSPGDSRVSPKLIQIIDVRLRREDINSWTVSSSLPGHLRESSVAGDNSLYEKEIPPEEVYEADLIRIKSDDPCPRCLQGKLYVQRAIELGHTFHLGTKYSEPLNAKVEYGEVQPSHKIVHVPQQALMKRVALQMGCHGIGVSRIIGAVAHTLADKKGLNWPRIIAPFEVVIVPTRGQEAGLEEVCNLLICGHIADGKVGNIDAVVDDREKGFAWKLKDADMIGYPVIIVIGRDWENGRECEVQCRRLAYREVVEAEMLPSIVNHLLTQL
ncbi:hypothetical protein MMC21_001374 [Puttea exsequens]|nr:hypothetical protein [Puttea exsequens]